MLSQPRAPPQGLTDTVDNIDSSSDDSGSDEYEVLGILKHRRVGKKRNGYEFYTQWAGYDKPTWEPAKTFRLNYPDPETNSRFLPVYDEYKEKLANGTAIEDTGEVSVGEGGSDSEFSPNTHLSADSTNENDIHANNADIDADADIESDISADSTNERDIIANNADIDADADIESDISKIIADKIRVLNIIVKGGVNVPKTRQEAIAGKYWENFSKAEEAELSAFSELKVWELVPKPKGANVVGTRWVYDVKVDSSGAVSRYKARLVAQGFSQKEGIDYNETFAPTMHVKTMRVLLALAARENLEVHQYDISTAFLHASLQETVYVRQPKGHVVKGKEEWVYKLNKAMYGLKNAPKAYSDHFMSVLRDLGFKQSTRDECLWSRREGRYYIHYLFHVDDILCVSNHPPLRQVLFKRLEELFRIRDEGEVDMFLGMKIERLVDGSYSLSQKHYIEQMAERFNIVDNSREVETPGIYGQKLSKEMCPKTPEDRAKAENCLSRNC